MGDIRFMLNTTGRSASIKRGAIEVTPSQMRRLPALVYQELYSTLKSMGDTLLFELKFHFYRMIHERPRNPDYDGGSSVPLLTRMREAFVKEMMGDRDTMAVMVFDLKYMDMITRNEGFNTGTKGWFLRFSDGHTGRRHGGVGWGFLEYDWGMKLAKECAERFISDPVKRTQWLNEMEVILKGRHGEGIMVRLDAPLFKMFPTFGDAKQFVKSHPGYYSWPAIGLVGHDMTDRRNGWVSNMLQDAFDRAVGRL